MGREWGYKDIIINYVLAMACHEFNLWWPACHTNTNICTKYVNDNELSSC